MPETSDVETRAESKAQIVAQIHACLRSGDYVRALDLCRGAAGDPSGDAEMGELEKLAQDGVKRRSEADRLITESQELFAQQKSADAIQLLRKAYELDKSNSLARAILANALVEHAQSVVESDWLKAETLTNQALALNPAHPTAKTILNLIVERKQTSSVEDWVAQASKLQSSGDLFAALAWVAEGLAVHPHEPKLLQIQDAIQRDQEARRRQARRGDLDDLRRMQREIDKAADVAAKQALAVRIQTVAAKHWTDGEILSIANALLLRLGLVPQESSGASPRKGATVILHVPRPSVPAPRADANQIQPSPVAPSPALPDQTPTNQISATPVPPAPVPPAPVLPTPVSPGTVPASTAPPSKVAPSRVPARMLPRGKVRSTGPKPQPSRLEAAIVPAAEPSISVARMASVPSQAKESTKSKIALILVSAAGAVILFAAIFFLARRHQAPPMANAPAVLPAVSTPATAAPPASAPAVSAPAQTTPAVAETPAPAAQPSSDTAAGNVPANDQPPAESGPSVGSLVVVAGQDNAKVFVNGTLQRLLTHGGQLRLPNLEPKDYVVQVAKGGFQDPPQQKISIRKGEQVRVIFTLQPNLQPSPQTQPRLASLRILGGSPGTTVFVDQTQVGSIQPDGTLAVSTINPGDHTVELRKDRFKPRQFKKHFVANETISLVAADAALEAAPAVLKITFAPADAKVALVKGDLLKTVSSGVPLNLDAGTYTLTTRTADRVTRSSTLEIVAGQSKTLDLSLAPNGMSKWEDPGAWKHEGDSFTRKGGDFVLYGVVPASGTFIFSAMPTKGHFVQWVFNYTDARNYVLFQMDENNFYRSVFRNGQKTDEIIVPQKGDKKSFHTFQIRVSSTELVHQIKIGESWKVLDRWTQPGANLSQGKFGFYVPGNDQIAVSSFIHYADLNIR